MNLIVLTQPPTEILTLIHDEHGVPLYLACLSDGAILRSAFLPTDSTAKVTAVAETEAQWRKRFPHASLTPAPASFRPDITRGCLIGTDFQIAVWTQLNQLQPGTTTTYAALASACGYPTAHRAVGAAVGANPLAPFVPCHRVLATSGKLGGFIGGLELKRQLLQAEGIAA